MLPSSQDLQQARAENIVNKEFDYDYETLKALQHLEIRQFEEKTQLVEDIHKLREEYSYKCVEFEDNIRSVRRQLAKELEEAKITLRRAELNLERAQMAMDHHLDSEAKLLDDLSKEYEEREHKLLEGYEASKAITLEEIQAIE